MPKNYQITQYDQPSTADGYVEFEFGGGLARVRITRAHLEEDVGKSFHFDRNSGVDFNRAGVPLLEIVSEPDLTSADMAYDYLNALKDILVYGGVSDCDMEKGMVRCDVNVSVRPEGSTGAGGQDRDQEHEQLQRRAQSAGVRDSPADRSGQPGRQTRPVHPPLGRRGRDHRGNAHQGTRARLPLFPGARPDAVRAVRRSGWRRSGNGWSNCRWRGSSGSCAITSFRPSDAQTFVWDVPLGDYFEEIAPQAKNPKAVANWVINNLRAQLAETRHRRWPTLKFPPAAIAELVDLVDSGKISSKIAQEVFAEMFASGEAPGRHRWTRRVSSQVSDAGAIEKFCDEAIAANPGPAADFRAGKGAALNFLKGQVMKLSKGKANPGLAGEILERLLRS